MANQWFRLYAEFATDPKVQMLSEALQRRYVMLMCMQCSNAIETFHVTERDSAIAFHMRISETEWMETKAHFIAKGFVNDECELLNWDKRQYESDSSTARVREFREREKQKRKEIETDMKRFGNVLEQNRTDTEQIQNKSTGVSASDTTGDETQSSKPEKPKSKKPEYPDWFEQIWKAYPPRNGSNDKRKAFHAAQARIKSGKDPELLAAAVGRYKAFVIANGRIGTEYTMQAATFFGPGEHIENPWSIQHAANQQRNGTGSSASKMPHADVVRGQARRAFEQINGGNGSGIVYENGGTVPQQS